MKIFCNRSTHFIVCESDEEIMSSLLADDNKSILIV